jgi:hypothetical protein
MGSSTTDGFAKKCVRYILLGEENPAVKRNWVLTAFILSQLLNYMDEIKSGVCPFCKRRPRNLFNHLMYDDFCGATFNSLIRRGVELHRVYGLISRRNIRAGIARIVFRHRCYVDIERGIPIEETAKRIRDALNKCLG